ncbi:hypothetical protein KR093_008796, partial [Drosophila rubida]
SIQGDVAKIAANGSWSQDDNNEIIDIKPDIRNGDCMWSSFGSANLCNSNNNGHSSGNNNNHSGSGSSYHNNSNSAASSYSESSAVPPGIVSGSSTMLAKHEMDDDEDDDVVEHPHDNDDDECCEDNDDDEEENMAEKCNSNSNGNNRSSSSNKLTTFATSPIIPIKRPNKQQQCNSAMRYTTTSAGNRYNHSAEQDIPPGTSLLRKSNPANAGAMKHYNKEQPLSSRRGNKQTLVNVVMANVPLADMPLAGSSNNNNNNNRSFAQQEDAAMGSGFRHTVDLAACLTGSNNISLASSSDVNNHIINHITRELQNGKLRFDPYHSNYKPEISEVIDVIKQEVSADANAAAGATTTGTTTTATTTMSPPASNSDCDSDDGDGDGDGSMVGSNSAAASYMRHISDHSYTRSDMEAALETPSDTDDEIDVVSLPDNKLPTNPSDRDRRALQTQVAHKMSTLPARGRYELPYTPASSSPVKSEANSRFPSPSSTPYQSSGAAVSTVYSPLLLRNSNSSCNSSSSGSDCATSASALLWGEGALNGASSGGGNNKSSRKRHQDTCRSSAYAKQLQTSKKSRAKLANGVLSTAGHLKQPTLGAIGSNNSSSSLGLGLGSSSSSSVSVSSSSSSSGSGSGSNVNFSIMKRQFSLDEADTIEKRNLHNDMERQRRIGLKNLFEALKKQIPNIRDKERAPKVNILREAAKLCEQLTSEERELSLKRQLLKAKLKQRQELLARLRLSANAAE